MNGEDEVPCCMMVRDPIQRDLFDVTIAPGIDPLMIICYMAVHSKMVSVYVDFERLMCICNLF